MPARKSGETTIPIGLSDVYAVFMKRIPSLVMPFLVLSFGQLFSGLILFGLAGDFMSLFKIFMIVGLPSIYLVSILSNRFQNKVDICLDLLSSFCIIGFVFGLFQSYSLLMVITSSLALFSLVCQAISSRRSYTAA